MQATTAWRLEFLDRLHRGKAPPTGLLAGADGGARGWRIYQASYRTNLTGALADVYPVLARLVGIGCFAGLARDYVTGHPSGHADLHAYGAGFPAFLAEVPELAGLAWLPDVARLEWRVHEAFHAADAPVLDAASLGRVPEDRLAELRLAPHPSLRLLRSDWPVQRVWRVNQPDWEGDQVVDLDTGDVALAVYRDGPDIALLPLDDATHALAQALSAGHSLGATLERVAAECPRAEPATSLHTLIHHRLLADFPAGERMSP